MRHSVSPIPTRNRFYSAKLRYGTLPDTSEYGALARIRVCRCHYTNSHHLAERYKGGGALFYYLPDNYTWSSAFHLALMAGAQFGEMDRWLAPLKDREPNAELWAKAWSDMAQQQEDEAALDLKEGYRRSA